MAYEVKMPQLGLSQDSGTIASWLRAEGEAVAKGDALFEVESDKATLEVEAAASGYLSGIRAASGTEVPVGDTIAEIVETREDVAEFAKPASSEMPEVHAGPDSGQAVSPPTEPVSASVAAAPGGTHRRILASPKARRLASERGIDLATLRAQGVAEPIHVKDLALTTTGGSSVLTAHVDGTAFNALLARAERADRTRLLAVFSAGAWRAQFGVESVVIAVRGLDGTSTLYPNPDREGAHSEELPALVLVDLCDSRILTYAPAGGTTTLSAARNGSEFCLALAFEEGRLPMTQAIALLDSIAARIENPIRQLL